jgi:hypothetical protein
VEVDSEVNRYTRFTVKLKKPANIERQILYQEAHAEIFYDARINATGVVWKRQVTGEEYRSVFRKCHDFVRSYNTPNYVSDMTRQGAVALEDQLWMLETIMPQVIRNGLKRVATIAGDLEDQQVTEYITRISEHIAALGGAEHRYFDSRDEAYDWLREQNERAAMVSLLG